jgi:hypothetical protein
MTKEQIITHSPFLSPFFFFVKGKRGGELVNRVRLIQCTDTGLEGMDSPV